MSIFARSVGLLCVVGVTSILSIACGTTPGNLPENVSSSSNALLPSGWSHADVGALGSGGSGGIAGSDDYASSTKAFTLTGSGTGLTNWYHNQTNYPAGDQFHFVYTSVSGDFEFVARVTALGSALSQTGIAVRENLTSTARSATIFYSPASSWDSPPKDVIQATGRTVADDQPPQFAPARLHPFPTRPTPGALPVWLKIVRVGGDVGQYWSRDGEVWIPASTGGGFVPQGPVYVGMFVASNSQTLSATSTFDQVYVGAPRLSWKTSWIGNSFNQASQGNLASFVDDGYVSTDINALWVAQDGSCWTNSGQDEAGQSQKIYKDDGTGHGKVVKALLDNGAFTNNSASEGSITGDGIYTYVFVKNITGNYIRRTDANGIFNAEMSFTSTLGEVAGLAASGPNHELYVSDVTHHKILVVNTITNSEVRSFPFTQERPGPMAVDSRGNIWIIQEGTDFPLLHKYAATHSTGIYCYTKDGFDTHSSITDVALPTSLAIDLNANDPSQDRLLVTDNGPNQNVLIYGNLTNTTPTMTGHLGIPHGIYSGNTPGAINDPSSGGMARFYSLTGVGVDHVGNIFVASDGRGADLRKFTPSGSFVWSLHANGDANGAGDFDPGTDGQDLFTALLHYGLDYSQTAPGKEWSYKGFTANPFAYSSDARLSTTSVTFVRRVGPDAPAPPPPPAPAGSTKRRLMFLSSTGGVIEVYRFSGAAGTGEIAIPAARFSTIYNPSGVGTTKLWVDHEDADGHADGVTQTSEESTVPSANGTNGSAGSIFDVDSAGDLWWINGGILHFTMQGLSAQGVPNYSLSGAGYTVAPLSDATSGSMKSIKYDKENDVLYLGSDKATSTGGIGDVLTRYDNWSTTQNNPTARYHISLPTAETASDFYEQGPPWAFNVIPFFKSFDVAGDYVFAWEEYGQIHVFDAALGNPVINIGPGPEVDGTTGWTDSTKAHAFKRANGEYELTMDDAGWMARNLLYRWTPVAATSLPNAPTVLTALSDNGVIHLAWNGPRGQLTKYRLYRRTPSGAETLYADNLLAPEYHDTNLAHSSYLYRVTAVNAAGEGPKSNEASGTNLTVFASPRPTDTSTKGDWKNNYGVVGYWILGDANTFPSWAPVSSNGTLQGVAPGGTTDVRALQQPGAGTGRELNQLMKGAPYPSSGYVPFDVDLNLNGQYFLVEVYICDFGNYNIGQTVQVLDGRSGAVLNTQSISSFTGGQYLIWLVSGHVKLHFIPQGGMPSSVSAIFLDPAFN